MGEDKKYCGNGKAIKTEFGSMLKLYLFPKDIEALNARSMAVDGGPVTLDIYKRREKSAKGMTHYGVINEYVKPGQDAPGDDVPF